MKLETSTLKGSSMVPIEISHNNCIFESLFHDLLITGGHLGVKSRLYGAQNLSKNVTKNDFEHQRTFLGVF